MPAGPQRLTRQAGTPAATDLIGALASQLAYAKNLSTIAEIRARGGPTYAVTQPGTPLPVAIEGVIEVPKSEPELDALLLNIPLQLLAYHVALAKDRDIDQPRNLAKCVTVE